jgi:DNA repair exonuclease SbcCD nuclease subunit
MALRVFLTSDLHLGMKFAGYPDAARAALVEARFTCLDRIVAAANDARSDLLVIAGDLFETVSVARRDVARAAGSISGFRGRLAAVLPGNHDYISGDDELWRRFRDSAGDSVLLLDQQKPYPLAHYDLDACLYPGPCTAKHSASNAIGWVRSAAAAPGSEHAARHHIGVAHGSLEGFSPDMDGRYYPMRPQELIETGVRTWLLGHTHLPFPRTAGARDTIFCAGTPEPDGFDCTHEGFAWILDVADDGSLKTRAVRTGLLRFVDESREIRTAAELERLERDYAGEQSRTTLLKLHLSGRAPREVLSAVETVRTRMAGSLLHLDLRAEELREEITPEAIDREYPAGSFPHSLLTTLFHDDDQEALRIAHELLGEMRS